MWRRFALALAVSGSILGCGTPADETDAGPGAQVGSVGFDTTVVELLRSGSGAAACESEERPTRPALRVLTLTANQCLTCESVGYVARSLAARAAAEGGDLVITSPASDTSEVCAYLRREKVSTRVIAFRD